MVIRHDVNSAEYLACEADYPAVFQLKPASGVATLVSETWAVTAAHCLYLLLKEDYRNTPFEVHIAGRRNTIIDTVHHPECEGIEEVEAIFLEARGKDKADDAFTERIFTALEQGAGPFDIALLKLEHPVPHVIPVEPYQNHDEVGQEVLMLGWGAFSTGDRGIIQGQEFDDGKFRQTKNIISGIENDMLTFKFDAPGMTNTLPLEGVNGPGDSGGPALATTGGVHQLVGVSSYSSYPTEEMDERARKGEIPIQTYGTIEHYTRVSSHLRWIRNIIGGRN